jgi:hypothetical protein
LEGGFTSCGFVTRDVVPGGCTVCQKIFSDSLHAPTAPESGLIAEPRAVFHIFLLHEMFCRGPLLAVSQIHEAHPVEL